MGGIGSGGRNKKPSALHVLHGVPGKRKLNNREPVYPDDGILEPPAFLSDYAKQEWLRIAPILRTQRVLTSADRAALAGYCESFALFTRSTIALQAEGDTVRSKRGKPTANTHIRIQMQALDRMHRYLRSFGLDPQSRAGITTPHAANPQSKHEQWKAKYNK